MQRSTHISSKPNWQSIDTDIADSEVWIPMSVYPNVFFYSAVRAFCSHVDYNEVWILTNVHPNFFFCPAGKADGEVLSSKVWSLMVFCTASFVFGARLWKTSAGRVSDSNIGRSEVWILIRVHPKLSLHTLYVYIR